MNQDMNNGQQYVEPINLTPEYPMNWYKFLIYFLLFFSAFINAVSGIRYITGSIYGESARLVYAVYDGLKAVDTLAGIACLALAALAIYTRIRLANYNKNGPKCLYTVYVTAAAINLLYTVIVMAIIGYEGSIPSETIISIVVSGVMVVVNYVYFQKRQSLFVNN